VSICAYSMVACIGEVRFRWVWVFLSVLRLVLGGIEISYIEERKKDTKTTTSSLPILITKAISQSVINHSPQSKPTFPILSYPTLHLSRQKTASAR